MKKIILIMVVIIGFSVKQSYAQIPTIVNDPLLLIETYTLGATAVSQLTTLANMLQLADAAAKRLEKVTAVLTLVSDVQYIISLASSTWNSGSRIINYVSTNKIINSRSALQYTGMCIYGTDNVIRHINRLTEIISGSFSATPSERSAMVSEIKRELEFEEKKLKEVNDQINQELKMRSMEMLMLKSIELN